MKEQILETPYFYKKLFPLPPEQNQFIFQTRKIINEILLQKANKLLVVVGPCSIHDIQAAIAYAEKLERLQKKLPHLKIVMRTYFEKPRTGLGWRGFLSDPFLNQSYDVVFSVELVRKFLLKINAMQLACATEFLNPLLAGYFEDLIGLGMIGARTSSSWTHRALASYLNIPIGFKNTTSGDIQTAVNAMIVASQSQDFININEKGQITRLITNGNSHTFLALRGSETQANFDKASVELACNTLKKAKLNPRVFIDCAHGNSLNSIDQAKVFIQVCDQIRNGNQQIFGLMLESFLFAGTSSIAEKKYGVSITDDCIDFETTKELLEYANQAIYQGRLKHTKAGA